MKENQDVDENDGKDAMSEGDDLVPPEEQMELHNEVDEEVRLNQNGFPPADHQETDFTGENEQMAEEQADQENQAINPMEDLLNGQNVFSSLRPPPPLLQAPPQLRTPPQPPLPPQNFVIEDSDEEIGTAEPQFTIPTEEKTESLKLVLWSKITGDKVAQDYADKIVYPNFETTIKLEGQVSKLELYDDSIPENATKSYLSDDLVVYKRHQICKSLKFNNPR